MEEDFFTNAPSSSPGTLLYESCWKIASDRQMEAVEIYEGCIKYRQRYMVFTFELRFTVGEQGIAFHLRDQ
jgi:hypothetical protein